MPIPEFLRDITAFLYQDQNDQFVETGSGFLALVVEGDLVFQYLVTCKHVVEPLLDTHETIYARINRSDGPGVVHRPLEGKWYFHDENNVDVAVMQRPPGGERLELTAVRVETFLTAQRAEQIGHKPGEGDHVFFAGLFQPFPGHQRNLPVYRFGRIALITNELIPTSPYGPGQYFLVEVQAYPFNSGAPLFVTHPAGNKLEISIAGVVQGFYPEKQLGRMSAAGEVIAFTHMGISTVIPIDKVWDILMKQDKVVKAREDKSWAGRMNTGA